MMGTLRFFIYQLVELNGEDPLAELSALNPLSLQCLPPGRPFHPANLLTAVTSCGGASVPV